MSIVLRGTPQSGTANNGGDVILTFDVAPLENDVVVVCGGHGENVTTLAPPTPATYVEIGIHTGTAPIFGAWAKRMGSTPDTQVVCSGGGNNGDGVAYCAYVLKGVDRVTFQDATATTAGPITSTNPDAPSITTNNINAMVIAMAGANNRDTSPGFPSGYSNAIDDARNETIDFTAAGATFINPEADAEDPPNWPSWISGDWYAITAAFRDANINDADGAPSINAITAVGTGTVSAGADQTATGAPSIKAIISAGTAKVIKKATGAVVIAAILASGTAVIEHSASGAPGMSVVQAAGVAEVIHPSSGAVSVPIPTAAGVAEVKNTSSGTPVISLVTAAGTASVSAGAHTANGAPVIPLITASGAAEVINISSGAVSIPLVIAAGTATVTAAGAHTANGAPSVPLPTASGVAEIINTATGAPSIPAVQAAGVAEIKNTASGAVVIPSITAAGIAETKKIATGAVSIPIPIATGTAEVKNTATGVPVLPPIAVSGVAGVTRVFSGVPSIAAITAAGVASIGAPAATISGTLAFTKAIIQAGVQQVIITLTADTWVAAGTPFDQVRQIILNGFTAAQSEVLGWNREVRDKQPVTAIVRTSNTAVMLTLVAAPDYDITVNETCTVTVPAEALVSSIAPLVATPTISILSDAPVPTTHFLGHDF